MNEHKQISPFTQYGVSTLAVRKERVTKRKERHEEFLRNKIKKFLDCYSCAKLGMCAQLNCVRYDNREKIAECNKIIGEIRSEH